MTAIRTCTECVFEVDDDWVDETGYVYENGDVHVVIGPMCAVEAFTGKVDKAIETFRLGAPEYEVVERRSLDRPAPGAQFLAHRVGGSVNRFELSVFWPIAGTMWVFRVRSPRASEQIAWTVAESFLASYQPNQPIEALHG
ncbi:MAG: hypothetical protein HOW73_41745 [Polyangiaceae bacterium]|nr:hypothetical protein [Polyangiaceae bacterium]